MSPTEPAFLPYGRHTIEDDDIAAVAAVLRSDSLTGGPAVARFERSFAERVGAGYAVACANGTAALHLASLALRLGPSDRVIVPSVTFLATANGPHYTGAEVVFADVDAHTGLMTAATLEAAIARAGDTPRAVFPVHLNGACVDMAAISQIANRRQLTVIEDACHAVGATYGDAIAVGSCLHSQMAVFSLHPVKTIAMGEGGVVTTNDPALCERLMLLRNHGMVRDPARFLQPEEAFHADGAANPWYYEMPEPGYNYRASEIHCALGLSQLAKLDRFLDRRRRLAAAYDRLLQPLAPQIRPISRPQKCVSGWHLYVVHIDFDGIGLSRAEVMRGLAAAGIGTQVHYLPLHRQPYWRARQPHLTLPGADTYYAHCLSLPLFPAMSDDQVARVVGALADVTGFGAVV